MNTRLKPRTGTVRETRQAYEQENPGSSRAIGGLYGLTIFSSAFLLFQVQPLIAKIILPRFGGAAAVWLVCLLFFQSVLLFGYLYAHLLTSACRREVQYRVHSAVMLCSLAALPILPRFSERAVFASVPELRVLLILGSTVGAPYFVLSSTTPLLQAWYSQRNIAGNIYRFYALSNAGSLLALLSYPTLIEPFASSTHQARGWSYAYGFFAIICISAAFFGRSKEERSLRVTSSFRPGWNVQALWAALAACGSALLLAITNHISQNIAPVPLLWVIPLTIYLLSFILCFEGHRWYRRALFLRLLVIALASMEYALSSNFSSLPLGVVIPLFCGGLFICCMVCHGELARLKPSSEHLTSFYLMCSLGGVTGALFVALLAPHLFSGFYELPIGLIACTLLVLIVLRHDPDSRSLRSGWSLTWLGALFISAAIIAGLVFYAREQAKNTRTMVRNFYGVLRVSDEKMRIQESGDRTAYRIVAYRRLLNGSITHGLQFLDSRLRDEPTTYYARSSGVGLAFGAASKSGSLRVGAIGLGAGTIATYGRTGDHFKFYEINPLVAKIAKQDFTFLQDSAAETSSAIGDGRLLLAKEEPQNFDLLVVDAFSGDAIPVHLLTREAFVLYFEHLKPNGLLLVHISNSHLDLAPVVEQGAANLGRAALLIDNAPDKERGVFRATWVVVGRGPLFDSLRPSGSILERQQARVWTDDYSSLLPILK